MSTGDRRRELVDVALEIIATRGIAALSTRALAKEVGLSSGAIFRHFASLDALLEAIVDRVETILERSFPSLELPGLERLERFVEARGAAVERHPGIPRLVLSEQFLLALPADGSARLSAVVKSTRDFIRDCIRDGQEEGDIRADVDAAALALVVMGSVQMHALSRAKPRARKREARAVRAALATLLQTPARSQSSARKART